jgi:nucleoside 2-deoxyribosyltransferase
VAGQVRALAYNGRASSRRQAPEIICDSRRLAATSQAPRMKKKKRSYTVYFAGELFNLKHLIGNAYLAEAIYEKSHGRYLCQLPQDFEPRGKTPRSIRDQDLRMLAACDLALFNFDGTDLDTGTVVEFMFAKFADIPSVVLRSDMRSRNDSTDPWNLMASFYPRTVNVRVDGLGEYKTIMRRRHRKLDEIVRLAGQHSSADAQFMCEDIAASCVRAFDRVAAMEPVMPKHLREEIYAWLPLMPGLHGKEKGLRKEFERHLERKVERDLL